MTAEPPADVYRVFSTLAPGDPIEVEHRVTVGMKQWKTITRGRVVRTERKRHGEHFRRNWDDKVFSDVIVLSKADGELTWITIDEFTVIRRLDEKLPTAPPDSPDSPPQSAS